MKKILLMVLAMLTIGSQLNVCAAKKDKKEGKGLKWEWDGTKSGNANIDKYLLQIDTLYHKVQEYQNSLEGLEIKEDTFTTGSWVFKKDAPFGAAFLGDIICHEIAFELFPKSVNLHDVRKANTGVRKYADEFHPTLLFETELTQYYMNTRENYFKFKDAYLAKFLPLIERMNRRKA